MKQSRFYILFFFVVCIGLFCSCLSNDDDAQWSKFNGVYVTVGGDNIRGYKLYTDFGAILVPTEESLNRIPWLKEVQRAIVSFNLLDENENTTQLEDGKTVSIRPRACFSPSYNKVKSQTKHVWLLTLL